MKKLLQCFLILLSLLPTLSYGQWTEWTTEQKVLSGVALGATIIDYGQTRYGAKNPYWTEKNPLLSRHPTVKEVNRYFIIAPICTYLILDYIDSEYRTYALGIITGVQLAVVAHNYSIGIKVDF